MPISRHFEIVYMLMNKKMITAGELAEHFEVSTRTIYRDIDVLSAAGIPVYSSKGKGGGISLLEGYTFNTSLLSSQEQDDLLMALQTLNATEYPEIDAVLVKIARLFKKEQTNWLEVDFSPWGSAELKRQVFPLLRKAIFDHSMITFRYYNAAGQESLRTVEPVQLLFKSQAWYLAGHCVTSEASRVFKISRMRGIINTGRSFEPKPAVPAILQAEEQAGAQAPVQVTLRISSKGAYRVYDEFEESMITVNEDGSYTVKGEFSRGPWLDSYLLSYGPLLEELSPEPVRARLLAQLDALRNRLHPASSDENV